MELDARLGWPRPRRPPLMGLATYRKKRNFSASPEPRGRKRKTGRELVFVVHEHAARNLHHDLRLEWRGVLWSFALPKGPPRKVGERRLAVHTEDHPREYASFEGVIPRGNYGAGTMRIWDSGTWSPEGDAGKALAAGKLSFRLAGRRLRGAWTLVQLKGERARDGRDWLLIKRSARASGTRATPRTSKPAAPQAASVPGARRAPQPRALAPELCKLATHAPEGADWLHEIKLDGYRLIALLAGKRVRLLTRGGEDWSERFPRIVRALAELELRAVLDGELVVLDEHGRSNFQRLQNALREGELDAHYVAFDLPWCDGYDLQRSPLLERKRLLAALLARAPKSSRLRYSEHVTGDGRAFLEHACSLGLEGAVSKPAQAPYSPGARAAWIKTKCVRRQEFVVLGRTEPTGGRAHLGALLVGYHDAKGELRYAGKVGTGFTQTSLRELARRLRPLARERAPISPVPRGPGLKRVHWLEPECVVEVEFTEWTADGRLRHPSFQGVREDKPARAIVRERVRALARNAHRSERSATRGTQRAAAHSAEHESRVAGVAITHPERVLYPELGLTKLELAQYYEAVAEHLLPHVAQRPLTLVRCPQGPGAGCFYQKHRTDDLPASIGGIRLREKQKSATYVSIRDAQGLAALVQRGVLELHPWGARADQLERPDRLVLDLDPGPGVPWARVVRAAHELRALAAELELESFVRTTGGKGLHVVLPIERRNTWDEAKGFTHALAAALARRDSRAFVLVATKSKRAGRIFLDYLRNGRGATAVASYSARASPGATVATPLAWDELDARLDPARFNVRTVPRRLARSKRDPWRGFFELRQALTRRTLEAVERL